MRRIRVPAASSNVEDDTKSVGASPKFFPPMLNGGGGRQRKSNIGGEPLGCLALLDAGAQRDRPLAFPSTGEILQFSVKAPPTVPVHRPRAVLSSPENDELISEPPRQQESRVAISNLAPKAVLTSCEDLPHASLTSVEDLAPLLSSKEVLKAVEAAPYDLVRMGTQTKEMMLSDDTSSCSTISNWERTDECSEVSNELVNTKGNRVISSAASQERSCMCERSSENQREQNGNEENLSRKHNSAPTYTPRRLAKQQVPKTGSKGNKVRVLRPWY